MSRIGKQSVIIPQNVEFSFEDRVLKVKGVKGQLELRIHFEVDLEIKDGEILVLKTGKTRLADSMWGTTRSLIQNMILGVGEGFKKQLELKGVGYKMSVQGGKLILNVGFSHPVEMQIPQGLAVSIEKDLLTVEGIDKQKVGHFAAVIRAVKKVEPYKGKGFRYLGEKVFMKEGKRAGSGE